MATPYQNVAKAALINWNGLTEEQAEFKIQNESVSELESQVYAIGSIKNAVIAIAKEVRLNEKDTLRFFDAVINGPEDAEIFKQVEEQAKNLDKLSQLIILSTIHDAWVINNSNEKTFNKKVERKHLRQYTPLQLIGWNEVTSDLLFLRPILEAIGITVDDKKLEEKYHGIVNTYLEEMEIKTEEDLSDLIRSGRQYYPILPKELEDRLIPRSDEISEQIIANWLEKDLKSANIFEERKTK